MARQTFSATVSDWVRETKERQVAVAKTAAQIAFDGVLMRTPRATGFLQASWRATLDQPQALTDQNPGGGSVFQPEGFELAIAGWDGNDPLFLTFSANYAGYLEYGSNGRAGVGMVRLEAAMWQATVDQAVARVRGAR